MSLLCPLCMGVNFSSEEMLLYNLVSSATQNIVCPVCSDELRGFDKFTVHLCAHILKCDSGLLVLRRDDNIATINDRFKNMNLDSFVVSGAWKEQPLNLECVVTDGIPSESLRDQCSLTAVKQPKSVPEISKGDQLQNVIDDLYSGIITADSQICHESGRIKSLVTVNSNSFLSDTEEHSSKIVSLEKSDTNETADLDLSSSKEMTVDPFLETLIANSVPPENDFVLPNNGNVVLPHVAEEINASQMQPDEMNILPVDSLQESVPILVVPETSTPDISDASIVLNNHEATSNPANVDCAVCSISFPDVEILLLHNELVHDGRAKKSTIAKLECTLCGKKFNTKGGLVIHQQVGHNGGELSRVSSEEQNENTDFQFSCDLCSKVFKKENYLAQHLKTHDEKRWNCDECGKLFATKYFLRKHKRLHTGEMPYTCSVCQKHFTFQQSYYRHMSYHTNEKPHACKECGRTFKELSTLYNHQRIHTGEKPFSCNVCGKDFRQRVSYLIHSRIHTGLKPYVCSKCQKSFRYKVMLRNHKCVSQTGVVLEKPELPNNTDTGDVKFTQKVIVLYEL